MKRRTRYAAMLVGCVGLAATLSAAGSGERALANGVDKAEELTDQRVQLFSLNEIIEPAASDPLRAPLATPVATVLTVIEAALSAASEEGNPPAEVTFHDESGLLILRAEEEEIAAVREALDLIREDIRRVRAANVAMVLSRARSGVVEVLQESRRTDLEAALRLAMIGIEKAQIETGSREALLSEAMKLAKAGLTGKSEVRELRTALEHARLAVHDSATKAEILQHQLESLGGGAEGAVKAREAQAAGELRMAFLAIERAQMEMAAREEDFAEARALAEGGFVSERELREQRVAMEHARLSLEQAEIVASQRQAQIDAVRDRYTARAADEIVPIAMLLQETVAKRQVLLQSLAAMQAKDGEYDEKEEQDLAQRLAWTEQRLALMQSRLAEADEVAAQRSRHQADERAMMAELNRRTEQLARVEAEVAHARDREAVTSREMIEHMTRLEVRLEETQRALEHKHIECADLSNRLREMMVQVEVGAARRDILQEELHRLRVELERVKGKD